MARENLTLLDAFFAKRPDQFSWVRPKGGPIGFPLAGLGDADRLCEQVAAAGALLLPGSVYDVPDHVRVGFGRANFAEALSVFDEFLTVRLGSRAGASGAP
jgi:hypothetical protein